MAALECAYAFGVTWKCERAWSRKESATCAYAKTATRQQASRFCRTGARTACSQESVAPRTRSRSAKCLEADHKNPEEQDLGEFHLCTPDSCGLHIVTLQMQGIPRTICLEMDILSVANSRTAYAMIKCLLNVHASKRKEIIIYRTCPSGQAYQQ
jgi:hypothetical protein